jgi:hypothetical protein
MVAGAELVAPAGGGLLVSRDVRIEVEAEAVPPAVTTASPAGRDAHAA